MGWEFPVILREESAIGFLYRRSMGSVKFNQVLALMAGWWNPSATNIVFSMQEIDDSKGFGFFEFEYCALYLLIECLQSTKQF